MRFRNQKSQNCEPFCHSVNQSSVIVFVLGVFWKTQADFGLFLLPEPDL